MNKKILQKLNKIILKNPKQLICTNCLKNTDLPEGMYMKCCRKDGISLPADETLILYKGGIPKISYGQAKHYIKGMTKSKIKKERSKGRYIKKSKVKSFGIRKGTQKYEALCCWEKGYSVDKTVKILKKKGFTGVRSSVNSWFGRFKRRYRM